MEKIEERKEILPHRHLIIDGTITKSPKNTQETRDFITKIVTSIGMKVMELGEDQKNPIASYCTDKGNEGMTASVILTTSHCTIHVWDIDETFTKLHFDLYSCSEFNPNDVANLLKEQYGLCEYEQLFLDRVNFTSVG